MADFQFPELLIPRNIWAEQNDFSFGSKTLQKPPDAFNISGSTVIVPSCQSTSITSCCCSDVRFCIFSAPPPSLRKWAQCRARSASSLRACPGLVEWNSTGGWRHVCGGKQTRGICSDSHQCQHSSPPMRRSSAELSQELLAFPFFIYLPSLADEHL